MTSTVVPSAYSCPPRYARADHSSPPMRTRPPRSCTGRVTIALRPTRASVPVREIAGMCTCLRAIGRSTRSERRPPTMTTVSDPAVPAPRSAATAAAPAASATGPRKKAPGVSTSPIASTTAITTQTTQFTNMTLEQVHEAAEVVERLTLRVPPFAVDEHRPHPDGERAVDVVVDRVADHHRLRGRHAEQLEHAPEDCLVRLRLPVH